MYMQRAVVVVQGFEILTLSKWDFTVVQAHNLHSLFTPTVYV